MVNEVKPSQNGMRRGKILSRGPGIVVLSPSLEILHMNRQAQVLISDLGSHTSEAPQPNQRTDVLPPALVDLSGEILSLFETRHEKNGNGQFVIRHVAAKSGNPVLVRGVGVPNGGGEERPRIVLLLTRTSADHMSAGFKPAPTQL